MAALLAISIFFPNAISSKTLIDCPPFMCDNNSKAKSSVISSTISFFKIISFKKFAFKTAALVVPGNTL